jgi:hypothetical protein
MPAAHPQWFRQPTSREHWIAAGLFVSFGVFFLLLFLVLAGWWFRWVILGLGLYSIWHGLTHVRDARAQPASAGDPNAATEETAASKGEK